MEPFSAQQCASHVAGSSGSVVRMQHYHHPQPSQPPTPNPGLQRGTACGAQGCLCVPATCALASALAPLCAVPTMGSLYALRTPLWTERSCAPRIHRWECSPQCDRGFLEGADGGRRASRRRGSHRRCSEKQRPEPSSTGGQGERPAGKKGLSAAHPPGGTAASRPESEASGV